MLSAASGVFQLGVSLWAAVEEKGERGETSETRSRGGRRCRGHVGPCPQGRHTPDHTYQYLLPLSDSHSPLAIHQWTQGTMESWKEHWTPSQEAQGLVRICY